MCFVVLLQQTFGWLVNLEYYLIELFLVAATGNDLLFWYHCNCFAVKVSICLLEISRKKIKNNIFWLKKVAKY